MSLLKDTKATLPSSWYYDPAHFALELDVIWYRDWVCIGRQEDIPRSGDYFVVTIGTQQLIVTRGEEGQVRVYHNTCRHRGSRLCASDRGHFRNGRIVCPYHTWTYSIDGNLIATPARAETDDFHFQDYSLYDVHTDSWGGFLFINLGKEPRDSLIDFLGREAHELGNWPLADMVSVHQERKTVACNWKVFWENYNECYHCPRVHPELCKVVPVFKKGLQSYTEDPDWRPESDDDDGRARIAGDLRTWTTDGRSSLPQIDGLTDAERKTGMAFASFTASMYVVGHSDYVRSVRLLPTGPESIEVTIDWLLMPGVKEAHPDAISHILELGRLVVAQDSAISETNQQGLKSMRHDHGVLVPQEYDLWKFHEWLRDRLLGSNSHND